MPEQPEKPGQTAAAAFTKPVAPPGPGPSRSGGLRRQQNPIEHRLGPGIDLRPAAVERRAVPARSLTPG